MPSAADRWLRVEPARRRIVVWGAGDQARVNRFILASLGCEIVAYVDDTPGRTATFESVPLLFGLESFDRWLIPQVAADLGFVIAIGNPYGHVRCGLHDKLQQRGLTSVSFAEPSALLCRSASIGEGLQVMPQAVIHNDVVIDRQCIINTRALVEHDCVLEEGVEIGPGAVLCGRVFVGTNTWVGAGAVVRPRVRIGRNVIVGAGAVVVGDLPDGVVAVGLPARPIPNRPTPSGAASTKA